MANPTPLSDPVKHVLKTVAFEDVVEQAGFTIIPTMILRDPTLSSPACRLYGLLRSYAWDTEECWPGQEGLGKILGLSDDSVRRYLKELVEHDLVVVKRRGQGQTNLYRIPKPKTRSRPRTDAGS